MTNPAAGAIEHAIHDTNRAIELTENDLAGYRGRVTECEGILKRAAARRDALQEILDGLE